jgi:ElaB/YqjD/DUF883 family membrane-anchored ribosome-binding protein
VPTKNFWTDPKDVQSKVGDAANTAADAIDETRTSAAEGLDSAASTLRDNAGRLPGGPRVAELAHAAAERLSTTADYVRRHDARGMWTDVERLIKENPGPSLLAAGVFGFLIGRAVTRD